MSRTELEKLVDHHGFVLLWLDESNAGVRARVEPGPSRGSVNEDDLKRLLKAVEAARPLGIAYNIFSDTFNERYR